MDGMKQKQARPSVLQQVSHRGSRQPLEHCMLENISKAEVEAGHLTQNPTLRTGSPPKQHFLPSMRDASTEVGLTDSVPEVARSLFVGGLCRWPGCDAVIEDFPAFFKHLHSEHSHDERSIAQWRVQQDIVQCMENQLILEKQKLVAMQLHLSEHKCTDLKAASDWQYSLPLFLPRIAQVDHSVIQQLGMKHLQGLVQHGACAAGSAHLLQDVVPSIDCYKYNNIRPPYTYAYLIRWSILESPDKQRTLNEIYNWFTTMFFYFRHNTATWKNAVRHNLSLHKCFVRVEGGKGAVWTVDETEYQRRKGQKYHRDSCVRWLTSYAHNCQENP